MITISISLAEALDRLSILEIKVSRLHAESEIHAARTELNLLISELQKTDFDVSALLVSNSFLELKRLNESMWDSMQEVYDGRVFGAREVSLTLGIIEVNKQRAHVKRAINEEFGSPIREAKSFF